MVREGVPADGVAMAFRGAKAPDISEADWADIEGRLHRAYRQLARAIGGGGR